MTEFEIRRLVIACDAECENEPAIDIAVRLAAEWDASLHGVFMEDLGAFEAAGLPFARQINVHTGGLEELDPGSLEQHFVRMAEQARAALESAASQRGITSTFSTIRVHPSSSALPAEATDLLIVGGKTRPLAGQWRLASRWSSAAYEAAGSVLIIRGTASCTGSIVALLESDAASARRVLGAAMRLAEAYERPLTVKLATNRLTPDQIYGWIRDASPSLAKRSRVERVAGGHLGSSLSDGEGDLLVLNGDPNVNDPARLREIAARTRSDLMFVR
jgi:hypothetical protein